MKCRPLRRVLPLALLGALAGGLLVAPSALADSSEDALGFAGRLPSAVGINSMWVILAGLLVMFMQAGFAMVEVGFARGKNAGSVIAKVLVNFSVCGAAFWAVGFAFAFGDGGSVLGLHGFFVAGSQAGAHIPLVFPNTRNGVTVETLWFFEFAFAAVALAIVWGTTLERLKFGVYVIYGLIFGALIYPTVAHWIFGGGWLASDVHVQDFAGSIVVDVTGAAAALAVLLLLGPRRGKYDVEGNSHAIPGHNMPLFGLGVIILWLGWYGFNPGSTLNALDGRFPTIVLVTTLAGCFGVLAALTTMWAKTKTFDIGMAGNGAIAGLVAITGPAGYIEPWAAPIIGAVGGVIVVLGVLLIDRRLDDPVGVLAAHGLAGVWGAGLRALRGAAPGRSQPAGQPRRPLLHGQPPAARRPGDRRRRGLRVRVRHVVRDLPGDPPRVRAAGHRAARGRRARHLRARHVRLPGAVHPVARARRLRRRADADRAAVGGQPRRVTVVAQGPPVTPP